MTSLPSAESGRAVSCGPLPVPLAEGYERWAPTYDHLPNPLLAREERYLVPLLSTLAGKQVLDLGCGTGRWLEKCMRFGAQLAVGIDCSTAMLQVANRKTLLQGRLVGADCQQLPFPSAAFDLAICSFALGHVPDLRGMARELARVLKPGADVFVSDLHPEAHAQGWRTAFRDGHRAVQIETLPRAAEHILRGFCAEGFECITHIPLCLGEPERPIFVRAGKSHAFARACQLTAILVCHFRLRHVHRKAQQRPIIRGARESRFS